MITSAYEQELQTALKTAINANDLIASMTDFDDQGQNDRLRFIFTNYQRTHLSSFGHATMIQDALASL